MQALRKTDVRTQLPSAESDRGAPERAGPRSAGDDHAALSPALQLRDHLAARLEELAQMQAGEAAALPSPTETKLPMQARVVTIVGLSMLLWLGLYAAATALL